MLYNYIGKTYDYIQAILKHPENCQLKFTLLDYSTDEFVYVRCISRFFASPEAEDCTPQKGKTIFCVRV